MIDNNPPTLRHALLFVLFAVVVIAGLLFVRLPLFNEYGPDTTPTLPRSR